MGNNFLNLQSRGFKILLIKSLPVYMKRARLIFYTNLQHEEWKAITMKRSECLILAPLSPTLCQPHDALENCLQL